MESDERPVPVRIAELRGELGANPATLGGRPRDELLYQALAGLAAAEVGDLDALVGALTADADPVLHPVGLRLLRDGIRGGTLAPGRARAHLDRLVRPDS